MPATVKIPDPIDPRNMPPGEYVALRPADYEKLCIAAGKRERAALTKDRGTRCEMQHRHFATIAAIIREMANGQDENLRGIVAFAFARELAATNPRFDRDRFLRACGVI
jgi:uncharacterized membrane-anchored protein